MMKLYWSVIKMKYAARMAYRMDFLVSFIAFGLFQLSGPIILAVVYNTGVSIPGWTLAQMMLLAGLISTARGFTYMAGHGMFWVTQQTVRDGTFDKFLTKPVQPFILLYIYSFDEEDLGQFLAGLGILIYALIINHIPLAKLWIIPISVLAGFLVFFSVSVIFSALTVIFVQTNRLHEFSMMLAMLGAYPKTMYGRAVNILIGVIAPIAIASYYPGAYLLGMPFEGYWIALASTVILTIISITFWHIIIKNYRSAGG